MNRFGNSVVVMRATLEGDDLIPEKFSEDFDWQAAVAYRSFNKTTIVRRIETKTAGPQDLRLIPECMLESDRMKI
ncbi:hypothetical protein MRX96_045798 [Rhipicephalus microplus]